MNYCSNCKYEITGNYCFNCGQSYEDSCKNNKLKRSKVALILSIVAYVVIIPITFLLANIFSTKIITWRYGVPIPIDSNIPFYECFKHFLLLLCAINSPLFIISFIFALNSAIVKINWKAITSIILDIIPIIALIIMFI